MFRVLTIKDVGDAFEESLDADKNGAAYVVFPDVPIIDYPELNSLFIFPIIACAKIISICFPTWNRINGIYFIPLCLMIMFLVFYILLFLIF